MKPDYCHNSWILFELLYRQERSKIRNNAAEVASPISLVSSLNYKIKQQPFLPRDLQSVDSHRRSEVPLELPQRMVEAARAFSFRRETEQVVTKERWNAFPETTLLRENKNFTKNFSISWSTVTLNVEIIQTHNID